MVKSEDGKFNGLFLKVEVVVLIGKDKNKWWRLEKIVGEVFFGLFLGVEISFLVYVNGCFVVIINCCNFWEDISGGYFL